jgi:hypothetical protein
MALLTLTQYKALRGITSTDNDTQLTAVITAVEAEIKGICGYDADEDLPAALQLTACDMVDHQLLEISGIKSQSLEGASVTYESSYSQKILDTLNRYRRIRYV